MAAYEWKTKGLYKADADVVGKIFEDLENTVGLTAENVVEVSRSEDCPIHDEFEWDNDVAAEEWRKEQAKNMIRNISVVLAETEIDSDVKSVRAFYATELHQYESIQAIFSDNEKEDNLLQKAIRELQAFKKKYALLSKLSAVFDAIDNVTKEVV